MQQMWHVRGSQSPLPYAIFITKILEHFGVSLDGETKVALNLRKSKVDVEVVHKMGFVLDPVTHQTYKHRTDRQPAPTDEPEPNAEPNQPESQAPSSSSAAMPTNQMIMDELVSLRGYLNNIEYFKVGYRNKLEPFSHGAEKHNSYIPFLFTSINQKNRISSPKLLMPRTEYPQLTRLPAMGLS
ncbi:hypothetical protein Lal_00038425 [Lupinus albus]|nr:hypothetical protein Lal_00038425 [Lupinus albus]